MSSKVANASVRSKGLTSRIYLFVLIILVISSYVYTLNYFRTLAKQAEMAQENKLAEYESQIQPLKSTLNHIEEQIDDLYERYQFFDSRYSRSDVSIASFKEGNKVFIPQGPGSIMLVEATAYVPTCRGCIGITKTGLDVRKGIHKVIAVDPDIIPLGSTVELIVGGESWGYWQAEDIGSDIQGFRIDILMPSYDEAIKFGRQNVLIKIIN